MSTPFYMFGTTLLSIMLDGVMSALEILRRVVR